MIKKNEIHTELEFGTGDICINPGSFLNNEDLKIGVIGFSNQASRKIGIGNGDIKAGQECKLGDFPVIMTFYKKESIDVLIKALLDAKAEMEG